MLRLVHRVSYHIFGEIKFNDYDYFHQALGRFMYFVRNGVNAKYELGYSEDQDASVRKGGEVGSIPA